MQDFLHQLNPEQANAAATIEGPVLVLAGAGTGKTRVITYRIAHMVCNANVEPRSILGMTFTNKAAKEMRERLASLIGFNLAKEVTLGTFHSFCARVLRGYISKLGEFDAQYTICGETDKKGLVRQAAIELGLYNDEFPLDRVIWILSDAKNTLDPEGALISEYVKEKIWARQIYPRYQALLENQNMVDFDDLLLMTVRLFEEFPDVLATFRARYHYILVDEYQDTNAVQFRLLELLTTPKNNICVVGDDDQSIYGWRGAQIQNILNFPDIFPGTTVVRLEQNYRSTSSILNAANAVIECNRGRYGKNLWTAGAEGQQLMLVRAESNENEAWFVSDMIWEAIGKGYKPKDIAVLYRSNHLSRTLEESMRKQNVPYKVVGSKSFFQRKEILDAAAYLRLCVNRKDDQSLLRILSTPPRGLGDKAVSLLKQAKIETGKSLTDLLLDQAYLSAIPAKARTEAEKLGKTLRTYAEAFKCANENIGLLAKDFLREADYLDGMLKIYKKFEEAEQRRENVEELINAIYRYEDNTKRLEETPSLLGFLESYTLLDDNEEDDQDAQENAVQLMTIHAAKGLEFPIVFIVGVEQGLFPHQRSLDEGNVEEERRLFYVAITRAKERLFFTHARARYKYGETLYTSPSKFLQEIPENLLNKQTPFTASW